MHKSQLVVIFIILAIIFCWCSNVHYGKSCTAKTRLHSGHMVDHWLSANIVIMHNSLAGGTFIKLSDPLHFLAARVEKDSMYEKEWTTIALGDVLGCDTCIQVNRALVEFHSGCRRSRVRRLTPLCAEE